MARLFDWRQGGFGTAPKFPHPGAVQFLLGRWWDSGAPWLREIAEKTLNGMARGGMYDQVGGGFHRYSVDERWVVPHFEKMASDNAELLRAYTQAFAAWRAPLHGEIAAGIADWCLEVLAHGDAGGFGASQDADVGLNDDGDYFTWSVTEARAVLAEPEWEVARRRWDIDDHGEMHHDPAKNVLWVARSIEAIAEELNLEPPAVEALIRASRARLKAARDQRKAPFVDRSIYVNWNAMLAESFLEAGAVLERADLTAFAIKTLERLWDEAFVPGHGMVHRLSADPLIRSSAGPWLLDDQVQSASAFLGAFEHTGDGKWLDRGRELTDMMLAFYWDEADGGFFDAREQTLGFLGTRAKPIQDAPNSSPNAIAAMVLLRLAVLSGESKFEDRATQLLEAFAGTAAQLGLHGATYLRALDFRLSGAAKIVVADTTTSTALRDLALRTYRPRRVVVPSLRPPTPDSRLPAALVCAGTACAAPVHTSAELAATLETFGRGR